MKTFTSGYYLLTLCLFLDGLIFILAENSTKTVSISTKQPTTHLPTTLPSTTEVTTPTPELATTASKPVTLPECRKEDIKYQYTECDARGGRWKVGIPSEINSCTLKNPPAPERQSKCKISCDTGQYFNIDKQKCMPCAAGTYSLNGGIRITSWPKIPSGFETWGKDKDDISIAIDSAENICKNYKWTAKGQYLESAGDYCTSVLMYSATLIENGNISFSFRTNNELAYFHIKVVNNWCSTTKQGTHHYYPSLDSKWKTNFIQLKPGKNAIFFEAAYVYGEDTSDPSDSFPPSEEAEATDSGSAHKYGRSSKYSIQIREIEITGLSYTSECTPCPAGTYSPEGSAICKDCGTDTVSEKGAGTCTSCPEDKYAGAGWPKCKTRQACKERDYYENWTPCDDKNLIKKTYNWTRPQICNPKLKESVILPKKSITLKCPPCNPGQFKNGSICSFCPSGTFSDGLKEKCSPCPVYTTPKTGIYYITWQSARLDLLHPYCLSRQERSCVTSKGWIAKSNHISSGIGHADDAELVLYVEIPMFTAEKSELVIDFKLVCEKRCRFLLEEYSHGRGLHPIMRWDGKHDRTKFTYEITGKEFKRFKVTFEKPFVSDEQSFVHSMDRLEIYALNITNAVNGGADRCIKCPIGTKRNGCIHCKTGERLDDDQKKCIPCPQNTFWSSNSDGTSTCTPCPQGSISSPGSTHCYSSCRLRGANDREYDLSPLSGALDMKGEKQFTSRAFPYFHRFNVSICGSPLGATCSGIQKDKDNSDKKHVVSVQASICRSYCYSEEDGKLCAQAMSLGEHLQTIRFGDPFASNKTNNIESVGKADEVNDTLQSDVSFFFTSKTITPRCPNGFSTLITMRCDPSAKDKGYLRPPRKCSHGTCNGCLFHLFWHSPFSCPICTHRDYRNITSACVEYEDYDHELHEAASEGKEASELKDLCNREEDGKSTTHHIWHFPKMCRDGVSLPEDLKRECSIFEKSILDFQVFILIFLGLGLLLLCTVLILCYRNRRLSYQYHRLIDATAVSDGELPAAEKCTLEEGEDDEEEVVLSRNGRTGRRILDRLKKSIGSPMGRDEFSEFETINLTEYGNRLVDDVDDDR